MCRAVRCLVLQIIVLLASTAVSAAQAVDWPAYNGGKDGDHYSSLRQINRSNVGQLHAAWTYDTGENGGIETNPLMITRRLYAFTSSLQILALDAATGRLAWKFDSGLGANGSGGLGFTQPSRGFSWWTDGHESRLFAGILNFLYCIDPGTGTPIASFGENGHIDLRKGLREPWDQQSIALTTPGIVYKDLIIVGGREPETHPAPPGDIRAFDVHTGTLRWVFHTIPRPGEPGYETWPAGASETAGAANNWAGMTLDETRGILYAPTGSAVMDFYGGDRVGDDLYANAELALDANTGKLLWYFQGVHHDIWDRDFPAPPALFTIHRDGKTIEGLAQTTKQGFLYEFDRLTGQPLFPISERPYPASTVPGEVASKTQPVPDWPAPFARQQLTEQILTTRTPEAHAWAVKRFREFRSGGQFLPFVVGGQQTVVFPGFDGGGEWGGPAVDPVLGILYVNANEMAWTGGLLSTQGGSSGEHTYREQCAGCHGIDRAGSPPTFPSLIDVTKRLTADKIADTMRQGKGRMPSFPNLDAQRIGALIEYLRTPLTPAGEGLDMHSDASAPAADNAADTGAGNYVFTGYRKFLEPDGYPAFQPPWGTLSAIDLKTGKYLWKTNLGEYPELAAQGLKDTGSENYGGPIVTAGGVLFIGATIHDRKFRAFDAATGELLWETVLPYAGVATPSTYMVDGKQYVVIAASGSRDPKTPQGGAYVAFTLP
jgi:quinoprotein glucose dehydrogenase